MKYIALAVGVLVFPFSVHAVGLHEGGETKVKTLEEIQMELRAKIEAGELKVNPVLDIERRRAYSGGRGNHQRREQKPENPFRVRPNYRPRFTRELSNLYNQNRGTTEVDMREPRVHSRAIIPYKRLRLSISE